MTFIGINYSLFVGILAPVIGYFGIAKGNKKLLLGWNILSLLLLIVLIVYAFFYLPNELKRLSFSPANIAPYYFPFIWGPTFIVPTIIFAHMISIRQLIRKT